MKNIILLLILTFTLTACGSSSNEESSETKDNQSTVDVNTSGKLQQNLEPKPTITPMLQEFEPKLSTPTSTPTTKSWQMIYSMSERGRNKLKSLRITP